MDSNHRNNWKIIANVLGCIGMIPILYLYIYPDVLLTGDPLYLPLSRYVYYIVLFGNSIACTVWMCGVNFNKPALMLMFLGWWALLISIWMGLLVIQFTLRIGDGFSERGYELLGVFATVLFCLIYLAAVKCYTNIKKAIKRNRSEIPRWDIVYTTAPTNSNSFNISQTV